MNEPKQELRKEVIKHSAAIQIHNKLTLLQSKAWSWLLYHAYDELPTCEIHSIPVRKLKDYLAYQSNDEGYLKEIIRALVSCQVEWNILDKDDKWEWGVAAILAQVKIRDGVCTYAFAPEMRQRLYNPNMYAKINLLLQNKFASKHALALWELCTDYLGTGREHGETPFIAIEQFRKLVGLENSQYAQQFKILNRDVIKPAVAEINRVSDLRVTVDDQRQGRKVAALKFKIRRVRMLPEPRQHDLFPDLDDMPAVVKLLTDAGLAMQDALEVWQHGFAYVDADKRPVAGDDPDEAFVGYVREKIHLLSQRRTSGNLANPTGFLIQAIRKNYGNAKMEQEAKGRARKRQAQELSRLQEQRRQVTQEMEDALLKVTAQMIEAVPDVLGEAVVALQVENNPLMSRYDARMTPLQNFHERPSVTIAVGQWLENRFPERFAKARQPFTAKLASIEARLKASEGCKEAAG